MLHARREIKETGQRLDSAYTESAKVLDESKVVDCLETDLDNADDHNRIVGIRNGLVSGAVLWFFLLMVVVIVQ